MGIDKRVADKDTVLVRNEDLLLFEDDAAHTVGSGGHSLAAILTDVLVSIGAVGVAFVAMQSQVKGGTMLNDSLVER